MEVLVFAYPTDEFGQDLMEGGSVVLCYVPGYGT
jgi:hypothetical protein